MSAPRPPADRSATRPCRLDDRLERAVAALTRRSALAPLDAIDERSGEGAWGRRARRRTPGTASSASSPAPAAVADGDDESSSFPIARGSWSASRRRRAAAGRSWGPCWPSCRAPWRRPPCRATSPSASARRTWRGTPGRRARSGRSTCRTPRCRARGSSPRSGCARSSCEPSENLAAVAAVVAVAHAELLAGEEALVAVRPPPCPCPWLWTTTRTSCRRRSWRATTTTTSPCRGGGGRPPPLSGRSAVLRPPPRPPPRTAPPAPPPAPRPSRCRPAADPSPIAATAAAATTIAAWRLGVRWEHAAAAAAAGGPLPGRSLIRVVDVECPSGRRIDALLPSRWQAAATGATAAHRWRGWGS